VLVAIDKFTKWIEYKLITKLTLAEQSTSSTIYCIGSASPTLSSPMWVLILEHTSSGNSARMQPLRLNMCQLRNQESMGRSRGPMA
jgi:hypothetical protein